MSNLYMGTLRDLNASGDDAPHKAAASSRPSRLSTVLDAVTKPVQP